MAGVAPFLYVTLYVFMAFLYVTLYVFMYVMYVFVCTCM
jgi:hypothetical protein